MTMHIFPKKIKGKTYYYLQWTWREKLDSDNIGKTRGSGKSRVRTRSIYLGTAETVMKGLEKKSVPIEVHHRDFGFVTAVYQTAVEVGLVDLLKEHIPGERYGVSRWLYFLLPIINRLQHATSKERMGTWASKTVLPDILDFKPKLLNSKSFWYAAEDVISEKDLRERRERNSDLTEELFAGIEDTVFSSIEARLFSVLRDRFASADNILLYDTTNFFTYIDEPAKSRLARRGHNKDSRHHLKQVGLAMCVDKAWGIPLFYRIYRGNSHDSKTFGGMIDELIYSMKTGFEHVDELVLVLDKGNNSKKNFTELEGKIHWVGSLVPSHYSKLIEIPLDSYNGVWEGIKYYSCEKEIMGIRCILVMTYGPRLAKKQLSSLFSSIEKLKGKLQAKWNEYKRKPKSVSAGIHRLIDESRYGKYISVVCKEGKLVISYTDCFEEKKKYFGKNLLFCSNTKAESGWIIEQYKAKERIEDSFKLLKDPGLIRWQPSRHWTDSKIRAFGFCCVMALVLIRVMQLKTEKAGMKMSAAVLKEELSDIKEMIMLYDDKSAQKMITQKSSIQKKLATLFGLDTIEMQLTIHNKSKIYQ